MSSTADPRTLQRGLAELGRAVPGAMAPFTQLHKSAMREQALSTATKELMAMAVGITQGCSGCIAFHGAAALRAGASREAFLEAVEVAILMGGGPATVHAVEANALLAASES